MEDLIRELRGLALQLGEFSHERHVQAVYEGHESVGGSKNEGQSHAYANAGLWLTRILDVYDVS